MAPPEADAHICSYSATLHRQIWQKNRQLHDRTKNPNFQQELFYDVFCVAERVVI